MNDDAREIARLTAENKRLRAALTKIRDGCAVGEAMFLERINEKKGRPTWWSVNVLQDTVAAAGCTAALSSATGARGE